MHGEYIENTSPRTKKGFTLIELSIVIVVIGLIIASILGGKSLLFQSQIKSQVLQFQEYKVAFNAFNLASRYWSGVKNGNGNNRLQFDTYALLTTSPTNTENIIFWEHLSKAGLIPQQFSNSSAIGVGYPYSKIIPKQGLTPLDRFPWTWFPHWQQGTATEVAKLYKTMLLISSISNGDYSLGQANIKVSTAYNLDKKTDDGLPSSGLFKSLKGGVGTSPLYTIYNQAV